MTRKCVVGSAPVVLENIHEEGEDLEAAGRRADGYQPLATDAVSTFYFCPSTVHRLTRCTGCYPSHITVRLE